MSPAACAQDSRLAHPFLDKILFYFKMEQPAEIKIILQNCLTEIFYFTPKLSYFNMKP